ncbi:MAG: glycosyltransferase [Syntrophobacteraceae bacterium]
MISVIIPTYNRRTLLLEAVESVLRQVNVTMETIVVDDGSTDGTAKALQSYGDAIRYVYQAHKGVSSARNCGIRIAGGEWLAFLDSDDLWLPRKLSIQMEYLLENPEIKICQTDEVWIRNGRRLNHKKHHEKPEGNCFTELLERCLVSPSAVVIHRDLFDEVGLFDETLPVCEDYDLWLRIGCRFPIGLVRKPLIVKRGGRPDQLSATVPALDRYRIVSLARLIQEERLQDDQRKCALEVLRKKCRIYGEGCKKRGKIEEAQTILAIPDAF